MKRKEFITIVLWGGIIIQIPILNSCKMDEYPPLSSLQAKTLRFTQNILLPKDNFGPSAEDINAFNFVLWILNDSFYDSEQKEYLISGLNWLNEESQERLNKSFVELKLSEQQKLFKTILEKSNWAKDWISYNISLLMEALLSDPIYGSNNNEIGWKWLSHPVGYPRATKSIMYPKLINKTE